MRQLVCLFLLLFIACGQQSIPRPELLETARKGLRLGDYEKVATLFESQRRVLSNAPEDDFTWPLALAEAEALLELRKDSDAFDILANSGSFKKIDLVARQQMLLGLLAIRNQELSKARAFLDKAEEACQQGSLNRVLAKVYYLLAYLEQATGNLKQVPVFYQEALKASREAQEIPTRLKALNNLGVFSLHRKDYEQAIACFNEARPLMRADDPNLDALLLNLGASYSRIGHFEQAQQYLREASYRSESSKQLKQKILGELGTLHFNKYEWEDANENWAKAFDLAIEQKDWPGAGLWAGNISALRIQLNDWRGAKPWFDRAKEYLKNGHDIETWMIRNEALLLIQSCQLEKATEIALNFLLTADRLDDPTLQWEARLVLSKVLLELGKEDAGLRLCIDMVKIIEEDPGMPDPEDQIAYFNRLSQFHKRLVRTLVRRSQPLEALRVVASSQLHMMRNRAPTILQDVDLLTAARASEETLMVYWLDEKQSYLWVIAQGDVHLHFLPGSGELEQAVETYLKEVDELEDPIKTGSLMGHKLYEWLARPAAPYGDAPIVIVPDGVLHQLAYETLPTPNGRYWVEEASLTLTPALDLYLQPDAPTRKLDAFLLVGDAAYSSEEWPPLPGSAQELGSIIEHMQGSKITTLTGISANRDAYLAADPGQYAAIHFAAHADINHVAVLNNAVVLSPVEGNVESRLTVHDLMDGGLDDVALVTLSACSSAGKKSFSGEGLTGFAYGFLWAGVHHVVAAGWNVDDKATALLMDRFYEKLAAGFAPEQALREAKLDMVKRDDRYRKPFYWGAFQIYVR